MEVTTTAKVVANSFKHQNGLLSSNCFAKQKKRGGTREGG